MFRPMRRHRQQLSPEQVQEVLLRGTSGVLSLLGDDGYPYGVPLSYVFHGERLYFHCATEGHKVDAIRQEDKASFCVIDQDHVVPEKYTTFYRSVIAFGRVRILEDPEEKKAAALLLAEKYAPKDLPSHREETVAESWDSLCMLEMEIQHVTGKAAKELALGGENS